MTKLTPQQRSAQTRAKNKAAEEAKLKAEAEAKTKAEAETKAKAKSEKEQPSNETPTSTNETTKAQSVAVLSVPSINFEKAGLIEVLEVSTKKPKQSFWRCGRRFHQEGSHLFVVDSVQMAIAENDGLLVFITEEEAQRLKAEPWLNVSVVELSDTPESDQKE